jgi:hypothetical protein
MSENSTRLNMKAEFFRRPANHLATTNSIELGPDSIYIRPERFVDLAVSVTDLRQSISMGEK